MKNPIPTPVAIGIAVVALIVIVGGGIWYVMRPKGVPPPASNSNVQKGAPAYASGSQGGVGNQGGTH